MARTESASVALQALPRALNYKGPKTSTVLLELIQPYIEQASSLDLCRKLAALGEIAWNWAVEPDLFPRDCVEQVFLKAGLPSDELEKAYQALDDLRRRKLDLFPDDCRLITSTAVHEQDDGSFYVTATTVAAERPTE